MRYLLLFGLALLPTITFAQIGETLIGIPQLEGRDNFDGYINAVYALFISVAALLAVVKIIVAGLKYMFSDIVTQKSDAKKDIRGALLGLVIVLSAVLILTVINPDLTDFDGSNITRLQDTNTPSQNNTSSWNAAAAEGQKARVCSELLCGLEQNLCENGGYFETDSTRKGVPGNPAVKYDNENNPYNVITCTPIHTPDEQQQIDAELTENERLETLRARRDLCNSFAEELNYIWDDTLNQCLIGNRVANVITFEEIFTNENNNQYRSIVANTAERYNFSPSDIQSLIENPQNINGAYLNEICNALNHQFGILSQPVSNTSGTKLNTYRNVDNSCRAWILEPTDTLAPAEFQVN